MNITYKHTVVGGTFDHFHKGHQELLDTVLSRSESITIGVSTEKLYKDKYLSSAIESYKTRLTTVKEYIKEKAFHGTVNFVAIDDIFGPTLEQKEIDAIFVTEDNVHAAEIINQKRSERGFPQLAIQLVPLVKGTDGKVISSERIRNGEIDRNGFAYISLFKHTWVLPKTMRALLREPFGQVTSDMHRVIRQLVKDTMVIAVGDIVTLRLAEEGRPADVSVIDFKTRRHEITQEQKDLLKRLSNGAVRCSNESGKIESEAVSLLKETLVSYSQTDHKQTIQVAGEEDLLTLPTILLAPLGTTVIYGLFDQGAVIVNVNEQKKQEIVALVKEFEKA